MGTGNGYLSPFHPVAERVRFRGQESKAAARVRATEAAKEKPINGSVGQRREKWTERIVAVATTAFDSGSAVVAETYTYAGVGGRVSQRLTTVEGRSMSRDFTTSDLAQWRGLAQTHRVYLERMTGNASRIR